MHLISPLLRRVARRAGQAQSILREGQQNTSISVTCLWCIFRSRPGRYCKLRRNEHSSQGFPALLTANSMLPACLYTLLGLSSPYTSLPLFYIRGVPFPCLCSCPCIHVKCCPGPSQTTQSLQFPPSPQQGLLLPILVLAWPSLACTRELQFPQCLRCVQASSKCGDTVNKTEMSLVITVFTF